MVDCYHQSLSNRPISADNRTTYSEIARWIGVSALLVSLIVVYAWSHNEILQINYQMEQLRKDNEELVEINAALRTEQSALMNPESIDREARKLGLVTSNRAEVRILDSTRPLLRPSENLVADWAPQINLLHE